MSSAIAATVIGGAGLVLGMSNSRKADKNAKDAMKQSDAQMKAQNDAELANLAFNKEKYGDTLKEGALGIEFNQGLLDNFEAMFGGIEENLGNYYRDLDPSKYATQNKSVLQQNMAKQMQQFNDTMAAQGLQTTGMKQQAAKESAFELARGNQAIDLAAEDKVRGMQENWLGSNINQKTNAIAGINQARSVKMTGQNVAGNAISTSYSNSAASAAANAQAAQRSAAGYGSASGTALGAGLGFAQSGIEAAGKIYNAPPASTYVPQVHTPAPAAPSSPGSYLENSYGTYTV